MKLATLVYVKRNGQTLMIHRVKKANDFHEGKWNGLGGKFEAGETPEECAVREVCEEAGLEIRNLRLHGFITFPAFDGIDDWYVFLLTARDFTGELIDSPEGRLEWIDDAQIPNLNLWDGDKIFLPWLDQEKFFSAKFEYDRGRMTRYDVRFY
jgi:8-oxo-dGTP diphosphatase